MDELKLYREMLRIRMVEEAIATYYADQMMRCPVHLSIGQEGVAAGVCAALQPQDYAMSGHRSHAHYLAKGGSLPAMLAEIYGRATGCCSGKGGSMHLVDLRAGFIGAVPIVGSTIPIATGTALSSQMQGENRVTIAFLGEGATEEGVFHESANFASTHRLPIVYVCENNLYSVYTPMAPRQPAHREVYEQAKGHGIESHQADGNDVAEVQRLTLAAVEKTRSGAGPVFLEFKTYRWREHCGPGYDNHIGYRTEEEYLAWRSVCPLTRLETKLQAAKQLTEEKQAAFQQEIGQEIGAAFDFALSSPYPSPAMAAQQVYAE